MHTRYTFIVAILAVVFVTNVAHAARHRDTKLEFVAFSKDLKHYVVKVKDADIGNYFSVRTMLKDKEVEQKVFQPLSEESTLKGLQYKYKLEKSEDHWVEGQEVPPDFKFALFAIAAGKYFRILFAREIDGELKLGSFKKKKLEKSKESGDYAQAMLKQVAWTKDGDYFVVVVNQKILGQKLQDTQDADYTFSFKFNKYKIKF